MSTATSRSAHRPLAYPGEYVEADVDGSIIEGRVVKIRQRARWATGPQYDYVLECGLTVDGESLRC